MIIVASSANIPTKRVQSVIRKRSCVVMPEALTTIWFGIRKSLSSWQYQVLFILVFAAFFALFILLPSIFVSGGITNLSYTLEGVLDILQFQDYATITALSLLYALFIPMQVYAWQQKKEYTVIGTAVGGGVGTLFAGIAGTAFCASCLAPILGLFGIGFGGVLFILEYRLYLVIAIVLLMLVSIYYTARKIQRVCETC